jgi:tripartite-type tricarboxylate transporter receptor subunit TctC
MRSPFIARRTVIASLAPLLLCGAPPALAQAYPDRPIRWLVGGAAGSVPDTLARFLAEHLAQALGQPVIVDNRPGAAGSIAIGALMASKPDGHTIALATMSQAVFNSFLFAKLAYNPLTDLAPVAALATGAMTVACHPSVSAPTLGALVSATKGRAVPIALGTTQVGSPPHVFAHLLLRATGMEVTIVPYKSGAEGLAALVRGDVQLFVDAPTIVVPQVRAGTIKALVVTGRLRDPELPDVPTVAEAGYPSAEAEAWIGLVAPAATPAAITARLNGTIQTILNRADIQQSLRALSFEPMPLSTEAFGELIRRDHERWRPVIKEAAISLD